MCRRCDSPLVVACSRPYRPTPRAARLDDTEQQPLGFLLATDDFDAATDRFATTDTETWADRRVAWFDADPFRSAVGVLAAA